MRGINCTTTDIFQFKILLKVIGWVRSFSALVHICVRKPPTSLWWWFLCLSQWGGSSCWQFCKRSEEGSRRSSESSDICKRCHPAGRHRHPEHQWPAILSQSLTSWKQFQIMSLIPADGTITFHIHGAFRYSQRRQMQSWSSITQPRDCRDSSRMWTSWKTKLRMLLWTLKQPIRRQRASKTSQKASDRWAGPPDTVLIMFVPFLFSLSVDMFRTWSQMWSTSTAVWSS